MTRGELVMRKQVGYFHCEGISNCAGIVRIQPTRQTTFWINNIGSRRFRTHKLSIVSEAHKPLGQTDPLGIQIHQIFRITFTSNTESRMKILALLEICLYLLFQIKSIPSRRMCIRLAILLDGLSIMDNTLDG